MDDLVVSADGRRRCGWSTADPIYIGYHDREWGNLDFNRDRQFEFVVLESAQAGLSWLTILRKRDAYRDAYEGFDPQRVARWGPRDVDRLLRNPGIVRNRAKIEASIRNARIYLDICAEHRSFTDWLLGYFGGVPRRNSPTDLAGIPSSTPESTAIAADLKKRGFRFFGPVIAYAHLQATGIVDDHLEGCWVRGIR